MFSPSAWEYLERCGLLPPRRLPGRPTLDPQNCAVLCLSSVLAPEEQLARFQYNRPGRPSATPLDWPVAERVRLC